MAASTGVSLLGSLNRLATEIGEAKTAASRDKVADSPTPKDPGGYQGATTHPTKDIDNRGQAASEGSRSSENVSDVNADQGAISVNHAKEPGSQDEVQLNIGTTAKATGEDRSVEDDYKAGKDDPGSDHPARTDNGELDGHKYANYSPKQLIAANRALTTEILADLANGYGKDLTPAALQKAANDAGATLKPSAAGENTPPQPKQQNAGEAPGGKPAEPPSVKAASASDDFEALVKRASAAVKAGQVPADTHVAQNVELQAGYELASMLGVDKSAAQRMVAQAVEDTIRDGLIDGDLVGGYLTKVAMDEASSEDHGKPGDSESGAGGGDGGSGGGKSEGGGEGGGSSSGGGSDKGGEGGGAPSGGAGGGGGSLGDLLGGGADPAGMLGGGAGGPGAGGNPLAGAAPEELLMALASALAEMGITPDQLAGMGGGAGGMGGAPAGGGADILGGAGAGGPSGPGGGAGGMGGAPMGDPLGGGMSEQMKLASAVKDFQRKGKFQFKAANAGTKERALRDHMKATIRELMPTS